MNDFVRSLIRQHFQSLQRIRLQSTIGNGTDDIFVDFQGSQSQPTIVFAIGQNQTLVPAVNSNTFMFLNSRDQNYGAPNISGAIRQSMLGTFLNFDGSTGNNWGNLWANFSGYPLILPQNGFLRFTSLLATGTPPANGSSFQVDISYFNLDDCECDSAIAPVPTVAG